MHCGDRIRQLRERKKLSVKGLANEVGVSVEVLESWESGTSLPEPGKLLVLAAILGTSAEYLDKGTEPKKQSAQSKPKSGRLSFTAAIILYFIGFSLGEFPQTVLIGGTPLFYYGTSPVAVVLLSAAALLLALGIIGAIRSRKR